MTKESLYHNLKPVHYIYIDLSYKEYPNIVKLKNQYKKYV